MVDSPRWTGVFDGHSGKQASAHLAKHLHETIGDLIDLSDRTLQETVVQFDLDFLKSKEVRNNGSTCIFALVTPSDGVYDITERCPTAYKLR